jgi:hypothetical protein
VREQLQHGLAVRDFMVMGQQTSVGEQVFIIKQLPAGGDETLPLLKDNVFDDSSVFKKQNELVELSSAGAIVSSVTEQLGF